VVESAEPRQALIDVVILPEESSATCAGIPAARNNRRREVALILAIAVLTAQAFPSVRRRECGIAQFDAAV